MQSKKRPYIDRLKQGQTKRWMHQDISLALIQFGTLSKNRKPYDKKPAYWYTIHENAKIPTYFCNDISFGKLLFYVQ